MNKTMNAFKISVLTLKILFVFIFGGEGIHFVINAILAINGINKNPEVSSGNVLTSFLVFMAIVLPIYMFSRMLHIGATRKEYYFGLIYTYFLMAVVFSVLNIVWLGLERNVFSEFKLYINYIDIFKWGRYGIIGMFIYQLSAYMLVIAFLNLLFSSFKSKLGIALYFLYAAIISVSMSVGVLRNAVYEVLKFLLFNNNMLLGLINTSLITLILFMAGWGFIKRRELSN